MNRKIDKFSGRLDFAKDSAAVISKTLNELETYLNAYGEDDAADIIKNFATSNTNTSQKLGHKERIQQEQFLEAYKQRNTILDKIRKRLAKLHDDMHDEQDTTIKDRSKSKSPKVEKLKVIQEKLVQAPKSLMDLLKNPFEWLKNLLLGPLMRLLGGKLLGILGAAGGALAALVTSWFAAGKWGFKLIAKTALKLLKGTLKAALKAGGWAYKQIKKAMTKLWKNTIKPKLKEIWSDFKNKFDDMLKKGWEYFKEGAKKGWETVKNGAKSVGDTGKDLAKKGWEKITNFFGGVANNVKNTVTNTWNNTTKKVADVAKSVGSTAKGAAVATKDKVSKAVKNQWDKLKNKVKSIADKIIGYFSKKGNSKAGVILAKRMPKALGKFMSKFIPGVGMALLAYDVYAAAKKSKTAVSFAVNLIDGISGGLISMGLAAALDDFDGENLGSYVDGVLKNVGLGLSGDELDIMKSLDMKGLEAQSAEVLNNIKKITDVGMDGSKNSIEKLEKSLAGNPQKQAIVNEYKRLATMKAAGKITEGQASAMFKNFVDKTLKDTATAVKTLVDPSSGVERTTNGTPVETVKNSSINTAAHDAQLAMQARTALTTMAGATDLAYKTALTAATGVAGRVMSTVGSLNIFGGNSAPPSVIVQG